MGSSVLDISPVAVVAVVALQPVLEETALTVLLMDLVEQLVVGRVVAADTALATPLVRAVVVAFASFGALENHSLATQSFNIRLNTGRKKNWQYETLRLLALCKAA